MYRSCLIAFQCELVYECHYLFHIILFQKISTSSHERPFILISLSYENSNLPFLKKKTLFFKPPSKPLGISSDLSCSGDGYFLEPLNAFLHRDFENERDMIVCAVFQKYLLGNIVRIRPV